MESDELLHVQKLERLGSEAAPISAKLKFTGGYIREAMRLLRYNHPAHTTLASILFGTRFKYAFRGVLAPTGCQRKRSNGEMCREEDSPEHMMACYSLEEHIKTGPESASFLAGMAKATIPRILRVSIPKFVV